MGDTLLRLSSKNVLSEITFLRYEYKKPTKQQTVWLVLLFGRFERLTVMMKKLYAAFAFGSRPKIACKTVKPAITPKIT